MPELIVSWVVIGGLTGLGAYLFSRQRIPGGLAANLAVGIGGALIGGYLVSSATHADIGQTALTWGILVTSLISAVITAAVVHSEAARSK